jgi:hypothetical protein
MPCRVFEQSLIRVMKVDAGAFIATTTFPVLVTNRRWVPRGLGRGIIRVMITHFVDDETGYVGWLASHSAGYVVNSERTPKADYLVLHRADCSSISGTPSHGVLWTRDFRKICAGTADELDGWAQDAIGTIPSRCGRCRP